MEKVNRKGLFWFLVLTFVPTYLIEFVMLARGMSFVGVPPIAGQLTVAGIMFLPGLAAFLVRKFITREGFNDSGLKFGQIKYYFQTYLLIPLLFIIIFGLTRAFHQDPDFTLQTFLTQYGVSDLPLSPGIMILAIFISSITFAPFINAIPAFGEEFGWRGYLLPKLLPLGTTQALVISGLIWGLWHAPLILMGFKYGSFTLWGIVFFTVLLIFLGIYIGYLRLVSGSVYLAAFAHGVFNAQAYGIWTLLFPDINPLLGGLTGLTGIFVFFLLSLYLIRRPSIAART